jgi:hypothetical protein
MQVNKLGVSFLKNCGKGFRMNKYLTEIWKWDFLEKWSIYSSYFWVRSDEAHTYIHKYITYTTHTHTYIHYIHYTHTHTHTHIHTYTHTYIHYIHYTHTHTYTHTLHTLHTHIYIHTLHTYIHYIHYTYTHINTYTHYIHYTYITYTTHTHIHAYIHTHTYRMWQTNFLFWIWNAIWKRKLACRILYIHTHT